MLLGKKLSEDIYSRSYLVATRVGCQVKRKVGTAPCSIMGAKITACLWANNPTDSGFLVTIPTIYLHFSTG